MSFLSLLMLWKYKSLNFHFHSTPRIYHQMTLNLSFWIFLAISLIVSDTVCMCFRMTRCILLCLSYHFYFSCRGLRLVAFHQPESFWIPYKVFIGSLYSLFFKNCRNCAMLKGCRVFTTHFIIPLWYSLIITPFSFCCEGQQRLFLTGGLCNNGRSLRKNSSVQKVSVLLQQFYTTAGWSEALVFVKFPKKSTSCYFKTADGW